MNGSPSSFVEHQRLASLLATGSPVLEVVVATHPGFGFSDRPTRPYQVEPRRSLSPPDVRLGQAVAHASDAAWVDWPATYGAPASPTTR